MLESRNFSFQSTLHITGMSANGSIHHLCIVYHKAFVFTRLDLSYAFYMLNYSINNLVNKTNVLSAHCIIVNFNKI